MKNYGELRKKYPNVRKEALLNKKVQGATDSVGDSINLGDMVVYNGENWKVIDTGEDFVHILNPKTNERKQLSSGDVKISSLQKQSKEDITQEDIDSIPWKGLEDKISEVIGAKVTLTTSVSGRGHIEMHSQELIDKAGIFKAAFKSVEVQNFGGSIEEADGKKYLWLPINFRWESIRGGSNGAGIMTAWYRFDEKKWEFRLERQASLNKESADKKIKEEVTKAPTEITPLKIKTKDVPTEKMDTAKEATVEAKLLLDSIKETESKIETDEKAAKEMQAEYLKSMATEEAKSKLQKDIERLTQMLKSAGDVVTLNAERVVALVEKVEITPILTEAVLQKLKDLRSDHRKIEKEYEEKAGVQMEEVRKVITQKIVEFPIAQGELNKEAFLGDLLKKIWNFLASFIGKLHNFSEKIDEVIASI